MKFKCKSQDEIPAEQTALYVERDGGWALGADGAAEKSRLEEFRNSGVALSVSESLTQVLRWVHWWNSTEGFPEDVNDQQVLVQFDTDFSAKGLASRALQVVVAARQAGTISQDTMHELFWRGEIRPEGRASEEESAARMILIPAETAPKLHSSVMNTPNGAVVVE